MAGAFLKWNPCLGHSAQLGHKFCHKVLVRHGCDLLGRTDVTVQDSSVLAVLLTGLEILTWSWPDPSFHAPSVMASVGLLWGFTAESEREKEEWIEAVQESIAETLSDYEVAEKIWFNDSNRSCADCRAPQPEWASINLGVVICKKCAVHWTSDLCPLTPQLFLEVGNKNANSFWEASLPLEEQLHMGASPEQRATFHRRKYRERKYRRVLESLHNQEQLNQALCAAVVLPDVVETMALVFSGADVMCATGDPTHSTPYLLAQRAGQRLQMEFLHLNKLS
ncbi:unnamed protein product, partial [Coregonus sp. 'balchen']